MNLPPFIQFIFLLYISPVAQAGNNYGSKEYKECIANAVEKNPDLSTRFSNKELRAYCYTLETWESGKSGLSGGIWAGSTKSRKVKLGKKDEAWLKRMRKCKGRGCLEKVNATASETKSRRKEYRMMSNQERSRYQRAVNQVKKELVGEHSKYDLLAIYHMPDQCPGAHWGPAFLPFHRELLKELEIALREVDSRVSLPYWDSTLDDRLPDPTHSILWSDKFLGNGQGNVTHGPFAGWIATHSHFPPFEQLGTTPLYRTVGKTMFPGSTEPFGGPYRESDVEFAATRDDFNGFNHCVDPTFEVDHGNVHAFVGGNFFSPAAPNEPAFFMHHAFIDYMWEQFRQNKQTREERETDYPSEADSCNKTEYYADAQMKPFDMTNIDGLSNDYTDDLYEYSPRPTCSSSNPDCGSKYLFCDTTEYLCVSKIRKGGNCAGFEGKKICEAGKCKNGVCPGTTDYE